MIGLLLFVASFGVLYWNEGTVDVSDIAKNAFEIDGSSVEAEDDGEFVYTYGTVTSDEKIGDGLYLVPGDYLAVRRTTEMYAWVEKTESKSKKDLGGSETTETTYTYVKEWVENPSSSGDFRYPEDHENPSKTIESYNATVSSAKIGAYDLNIEKLSLPGMDDLTLNEQKIDLSVGGEVKAEEDEAAEEDVAIVETDTGWVITTGDNEGGEVAAEAGGLTMTGNYVFSGEGSLSKPEVGDMRISYSVVKNNAEGTVFGKVEGQKITPYIDEKTGTKVYRFFDGTRDESLATLHEEYNMKLWIFRLIGFFMMWFGLSSLFAPISVLLDVVPAFGSLSRGIIGAITFISAAILSILTIIVSMILHSLLAVIITVVIAAAIILYVLKMKGQKPKAAAS